MKHIIIYLSLQNILLLFLLRKDRNDGEKKLFKQQPWKPSHVVLIIFSMTIFLLILNLLVYFLYHFLNINLYNLTKPFYPYFLLLCLSLLLITLLQRKKQGFRTLGFKKETLMKNIGIGIGVAILFFIIHIALVLFVKQIKPGFNIIDPLLVKKYLDSSFGIVTYFFASILWGPFVEESIYRGILYSPYRKKYGPTTAIIITSLFFSFGHFEITGESILIGVLWGILYEKTESIVSPMAAHSTHNLLWLLTEICL
jgi:uncharacterized protein